MEEEVISNKKTTAVRMAYVFGLLLPTWFDQQQQINT
jgi:hypothetical protein